MNRNDNNNSPVLEPRVAKLEVGLDRLTEDVRGLVTIVREQGTQVEGEIQKLVVAVTQASGPRKTDWSVIISSVLLILAIGSAVFWPLNQIAQENKAAVIHLEQKYDDHSNIEMHPVGMALVDRLEEQLKITKESHDRDIALHIAEAKEMHIVLRERFDSQLTLLTKTYELQLKSLEAKNDLHNDRIFSRVVKLEDKNLMNTERDNDELQLWRQDAMGLHGGNSPSVHSHLDVISPQK